MNVDFVDAGAMSETDRAAAVSAYTAALQAVVADPAVLEAIYEDSLAGGREGIARFESCQSAWDHLDRLGCTAARNAIGYWPRESAHFEVSFC